MLKCRKCGFQAATQQEESDIHYHHIIPKCIGGTDADGRIALCKKCHDILHNILPKIMWEFVSDKEECKKVLESYTICNWKRY